MINTILIWFSESNDIITPIESEFKKTWGTNDHLIMLETFVIEAFVKNEHRIAVFFDLQKANATAGQYVYHERPS